MDLHDRYHLAYAAAFVRGKLAHDGSCDPLFTTPLAGLDDSELAALFEVGQQRGLKLHDFKRSRVLPRVQKAIGYLKGFGPSTLLDVGTGRGAFLWPCLAALPQLEITCIDLLAHRVEVLAAVSRGGLERLRVATMDVRELAFDDRSFDGVTVLETLEHLPDPGHAAAEAVRVARRFVIASVPSRADDNPEHVQLFSQQDLEALFLAAGARRLHFDSVLNHRLVLALR